MSDELTNREAALIVASFEEAAQHTPVMVGSGIVGCTGCEWNSMEYPPFSQHIRALTPAKVRLRAEIRELERVDAEAKSWAKQFPDNESRDHEYHFEFHPQCTLCRTARLAAISQELAEKRERLEREK